MAVSPEDEKALDKLIDDLCDDLDERIEKGRKLRDKRGDTPSSPYDLKRIKKTKAEFAAMLEEDPLADSGEVNGAATQALRSPLPKRTAEVQIESPEEDDHPSWWQRLTGRLDPA